jgi:hypothetical protein
MTTDDHTHFARDPVLARAAGYPYGITATSFTLVGGAARPFDAALTRGRTPVIGYGSNQSPEQLCRKYGANLSPIPVQRAWLDDHDVVYAAHFASYGSLPAALRHTPGTRVAIAVNWLDDEQLAVMHPTEQQNYHYARLNGIALHLAGGDTLDSACVYLGFRGHVARDGVAIALAEVKAENRTLPALGQLAALALMRDRMAPGVPLADFVRAHIDDAALRAERVAALRALSVAVVHAAHDVLGYDGATAAPADSPNS